MPAIADDDPVEDHPQAQRDSGAPSPTEARQGSTREAPENSNPPPPLERARALLACSASAWPLLLRRLSFATELVPLPEDVAAWMRSGGRVWLPEGSGAMPVRAEMDEFDIAEERERFGGGDDDEEEGLNDDNDSPDSDDDDEPALPQGLADFSAAVDAAIARLGGRAFPKLDWSAPLDAAWLRPGGSLECTNADEVLLLLKSSDRISHDLDELSRVADAIAAESPSSLELENLAPTLALRKWHALRPGAEFRVFLDKNCELVALCQRDITQHFEGLTRDRAEVLKGVARFVRRELAPALSQVARPASPMRGQQQQQEEASSSSSHHHHHHHSRLSALSSSRLVADVYVHESGKVRLVDLALPEGTTSPLLFSSWEEVFAVSREGRGGGEGEDREEGGEEEDRPNGRGNGDRDHDDASDAEFSLPCSSSDDDEDDGDEDEESEDEGEDGERARGTNGVETKNKKRKVRFRVVSAAGGIAPGRTLYGAPHDFLDGECVEALVERLRTSEG